MFSILIATALKSTVVLGAAWVLAFVLRGRSAAARHLVWTAAAAAVLALPFLSVSLPGLPVPASTGLVFHALSSASGDAGATTSVIARNSAPTQTNPAPAWRPDWRMMLMLLWAAGVAVAFAQMVVACAAIWRVRRSAKPFSDSDLCGALSRSLGLRRPVDVLETNTGSMPMTFGLLRSAIFIPSDAAHWSDERRRVVLLHELAHVRRGDVGTHLLARAALSLYWWNPLAWIAWREFLKERERATDDLVLNAGARASEYASHLLEVARSMQSSAAIGWAAVAMARRSQLEGRLLAILDTRITRKAPGRAAALVASLLAIALVAPFAAVQAQDSKAQVPADVDAAIRAANSQKNHEMLESAAKAAEQLRQYDTAHKLLESAVAIRADVSGEKSVAYGVGLLKLGDLEQRRHQTRSAQEFYGKAADVLGDRPEAAPALMSLGTAALVNKDLTQAMEYFQHAQRVDPDHAAPALMWMAVVRQRQQNMDEADRLYQSALASSDPAQTAITMKVYAQFLHKQGRADEAGELDARVAAMRKARVGQVKPQSADVYRVGGDVTSPQVLQKVEPQYSDEARVVGLAGSVVVSVEVGTDGLAHNIRVLQGLGLGLDENAVDAISQWQFKPGTKDGEPVTVAANIEVNFRMM